MARGARTTEPTDGPQEAKPAPKRVRKPRAAKAAPAPVEPPPIPPSPEPLPPEAIAHQPCLNCGTPLVGHYCHECGQQAHLHNRLGHLLHEFVEGIAHFDGRLWRTLPVLTLNPGRLSREWIEGKRVRYVAPLHVFLFAVFLMFTAMSLVHYPQKVIINGQETVVTQENREKAFEQMGRNLDSLEIEGDGAARTEKLLQSTIGKFAKHSDYYSYKIKTLLYKLSFLMAPISMAILWLLLLYKRRFTLYDHGVVALYGLGFLALLQFISVLLPPGVRDIWTFLVMIAVPIHAIRHLKGAYGLGWPSAISLGVVMGTLTLLTLLIFFLAVAAMGLLL